MSAKQLVPSRIPKLGSKRIISTKPSLPEVNEPIPEDLIEDPPSESISAVDQGTLLRILKKKTCPYCLRRNIQVLQLDVQGCGHYFCGYCLYQQH